MEKQSSFRTWTMEKQQSIFSVTFEKQPSIQRVMEEQQCFHGVHTNKVPGARGVIEKQQSFHGVTIDKQLSTCDGKTGVFAVSWRTEEFSHSDGETAEFYRVVILVKLRSCCRNKIKKARLPFMWLQRVQMVEEMLQHMNLETASIAARNGYDSFHAAAK
ncbi:hypothetical protein WN943_014316 [Citrus x changshan-huyou]